MAALLYRLGLFAARKAWHVIVIWIIVLGVAVGMFLTFGGTLTNSFDIPGTASGAVTDDLAEKLPDTAGGTGTVVVSTADGSAFTAEQKQAISQAVTGARDIDSIADVIDPFDAQQRRDDQARQLADARTQITDARAQLDNGQSQLDAARAQLGGEDAQLQQQQTTLDASRAELDANAEKVTQGAALLDLSDGIRVVSDDGSTAIVNVLFTEPRLELSEQTKQSVIDHFTSDPILGVEMNFATDLTQGVPQIFGVGEAVGLAIAAVVLIVVLGSLIAASLPIVTAFLGVAVGVTASLTFSGVLDMASVTPVLGVMLGLAVGIDYSLFLVSRHRKQLLRGVPVVESIGLATGMSGTAVVFAGSTVIVALLALNITGIPFLATMGTVGAACVAIAVLVVITLTPALLSLIGPRLLRRKTRARIGRAGATGTPVRAMSTVRAVVTVLAAVAVLLVIAIPALSMRLGLPDGSSEAADSTSYRAFQITEEQFGAGANGPLLVAATIPGGVSDDDLLATQVEIAHTLADQPDVIAVAPIVTSEDNSLLAFQALPAEGPNSISTDHLVRAIRDLPPVDGDITLGVAGQAAANIDISEGLGAALPVYLAVVVGLSLLIMIAVFRSLLVPIIATGGFVLSLFATFGLIVSVFQFGWGAQLIGLDSSGPILSFLPVILVGILFGLAMDYQLFLASGMREAYVNGSPPRLAVAQGFRAGRSVVIAAALIMVSVFGGFIFSEANVIRSTGFGLAAGVLIDAFVVRMLLMPALMHLLGRSAWWLPRWLDRILPHVDIEGAALERDHPGMPSDAGPVPRIAAGDDLPLRRNRGHHVVPPVGEPVTGTRRERRQQGQRSR